MASTNKATDSSDGGDIAKAVAAFRADRRLRHPKARAAGELMDRNEPGAAEALLSPYLEKHPRDASALNLMAEIASRLGQHARAEPLLAECLELSPDFALARFNHAWTLHNLNRLPAALAELGTLLEDDPHNFLALDLKSVILALMGRHADSMLSRRQLVEDHPRESEVWIKYGSALRSLGERDGAIAAWRTAIGFRPSAGGAWWDLADLKTYVFSDAEIAAMSEQLARGEIARQDRVYLHFSLGKAYADRKEFGKSFENYARANALRRGDIDYDPDSLSRHVARCKAALSAEFFESRRGTGSVENDPIFVLGMQRAGSTLVEQILASHSQIEATAELPDISLMAEHIGTRVTPDADYPEGLTTLDAAAFAELGARYLESTPFRRTPGKPFFVDKMPYNFLHIGLIHLILPNAKIVDVRRHPAACCFSNFSLHFETGPLFAHRLSELGRAYADYVALLAHFDAVLPGRIHRIFYEDLVREPEREIRRLLDFLGLPFEDPCLRFHENDRAMSSVSAEQVRKPISAEAIDFWRDYEPWLGPLKIALGPVLDAYPRVPEFSS
jgi:tetratricopeptide (TPR) repeat protein